RRRGGPEGGHGRAQALPTWTIGRNPYFSSRKPLTSNHPSSPRNFDGAGVVSAGFSTAGGFSTSVCAPTGDAQRSSAVSAAIARRAITTAMIFHGVTGTKQRRGV